MSELVSEKMCFASIGERICVIGERFIERCKELSNLVATHLSISILAFGVISVYFSLLIERTYMSKHGSAG